MFWKQQFLLELRRHGLLALALLFLAVVRGLSGDLSPGPLSAAPWRLAWMLLIALVVLAEPFEPRAFWRTRPIPRTGLVFGKLLFLLAGCWLPAVLSQTVWLWRLGPPDGMLPWLALESAHVELLNLLAVLAVVLAAGTWPRTLATLLLVSLGFLILGESGSSGWLAPPGVRGAGEETRLVFQVVALPTLLAAIGVQVSRRARRPSLLEPGIALALALVLTFGVRDRAHWRLDPAPLQRQPWNELAQLGVAPAPGTGLAIEVRQFHPGHVDLVAELALDRPLPPGHGLQVRQVRARVELADGQRVRSVVGGGAWSCGGRQEAWRSEGLVVPEARPCSPRLAPVTLAQVDERVAEQLEEGSARIMAELQVDLFRYELNRTPFAAPEEGAMTAGCKLRQVVDERHPTAKLLVHRRRFESLYRQHRLDDFESYFRLPGTGTEDGEIVDWVELGRSGISYDHFREAGRPRPHDEIRRLHSTRRRADSASRGPALPPGTELICEERILVDRATLQLEIAPLGLGRRTAAIEPWSARRPTGDNIPRPEKDAR